MRIVSKTVQAPARSRQLMWQDEPPVPQYFGPYQVLEVIGSGGMGTVYRARDTRLHREVALKVLRRNVSVSRARDRFLREARAVSSLSHPSICTLFDIGEHNGDPFLVMELLRGESLKERIQRGPLPPEEIRQVAVSLASALQSAHGRGIIHRDIKSANVFLVKDRLAATDVRMDVRILDFGLAKITTDAVLRGISQQITRYGATVGTVEYMSPEQARGELLDARSDLFSLGAVLYETATGRLPFRGSTSAVVFSELLNEEPTPPRKANLAVPADLDRVIRRLLIKDRQQRIQSAAELLALLDGKDAGEDRKCEIRNESAAHRVPPSYGQSHQRRSARTRDFSQPLNRADLPANNGDVSDPIARSGERRQALLAESARPVARYVLVDRNEEDAACAGSETAFTAACIHHLHALVFLLASILIAGSALLLAHAYQ